MTARITERISPEPIKHILINIQRLLKLAWSIDKWIVALYYATSIIGAIVPILASLILKYLIDELTLAQTGLAPTIPIVLVAVLASHYIVYFLYDVGYYGVHMNYLDYLYRYKLQNAIGVSFYEKAMNLDIAYFEDPKTQDLITKVKDTMLWRLPEYLRMFSYFAKDIIAYVSAFIVLIQFGLWIPITVTLVTLPRLYLRARHGNTQWSLWGSGASETRRLWYLTSLFQNPTAVREMRIFQSSQRMLNKLKSIEDHLYELHKKPLDIYLKVLTIPPIAETLVLFAIVLLFFDDVTSSAITIGSYTLLINMLSQLNARASSASANLGSAYENNLYANQYFELMNLPPLVKKPDNPIKIDSKKPPKIEFKNVSFRYKGGPYVLKNISFVIEPGDSIAFVGHNGAGKTTIVKLLCRFYDVTKGEIYIDGHNIKNIDLESWYGYLGTLFQSFVRYHFTVRENIQLSNPDINDEKKMKEAARKANAHKFINKLPDGYDQILGREYENGEELSGGQWQKLAIARAFYEEPPILILDEPTSAIDAEAEYEIFTNLEKHYTKKTLILISHRFSTVRNANKIIVIENGKLIEQGTHEKLLKLKGIYARMFTLQAKGYR